MEEKKDIFDRIMGWGFLKIFEPFYKKNKEMLLYLFFGALTTAVSFITLGIPQWLLEKAGVSEGVAIVPSNIISWICAVTFAYVTNRIWVFESRASGKKEIISEASAFYGGRLLTLVVETLMMWVGVSLLGVNKWIMKVIASVVVLILNYIISKLFVFKGKPKN
ncbi:MAG: GtrA family protein [Ruminococcus sp.]|nr:GtrA family protein [Ruminococcus sp.]